MDLTFFGFDEPEGDPGAHHDDGQRDVDLEEVVAQCTLKLGQIHTFLTHASVPKEGSIIPGCA